MKARDALDRISYMDELIRESRANLSRSWWVLFIWGILFCLAGLWGFSRVDARPAQVSYLGFVIGYVLFFSAFIGLPILFSILLARPSTELTKRLLLLNVLLVAMFLAISLLAMNQTTALPLDSAERVQFDWGDFLPIMAAGTLLIATGIFLSRSLAMVGLLVVALGAFTTLPGLQGDLSGGGPVTRGSIPGMLWLLSGVTLIAYALWVRSHRNS